MLYKKIQKICDSKGLTVSGLEKDLGFSNSTIRKWKNSSPSIENLKKVADYFGITVDELISEETGDDTPRVHLTVQKITDGYAECDVRLTAAGHKRKRGEKIAR